MPDSITRRDLLTRALMVVLAPSVLRVTPPEPPTKTLKARLAEIEKLGGGRLGCAVLNTATRSVIAHRGGELFPMCSTFKVSAAAFVLQRVDRGLDRLERRIAITQKDILAYAPITKLYVGKDMSVADLCAAALTVSDNTAANLLLSSFGGPPALTQFWRSIGDNVSRLDRNEPDLNAAVPGDPRDTTSPLAMLENLHKFLLSDLLKPPSRDRLTQWLVANTTGDARLRAGLPKNWMIGDKTGSGDHSTSNDIAIVHPPNREPFLVAAYLTEGPGTDDSRNAILADVGRAVADDILAAQARALCLAPDINRCLRLQPMLISGR